MASVWSPIPSIHSHDEPFEVDGANAARGFIRFHTQGDKSEWNEQRLQQISDSIALHATPVIALYAQPVIHVVS
jgi:hypothetical protein